MKAALKILKVIILTVVTFGLYGAWWVYKNIFIAPTFDEDISEEERESLEAQKALSSLWIMQTFHKS